MHNIQGANLNIVNTGGLNGLSGNGSGVAHGSSPGQPGLTVQFNQNNIPNLVIDLYPNPVSNFTVNNICLGEIFQPVNTSNVSVLSSSTLVSYNWNFGDGTTSTLMNPIHVYNSVGNYTISLEVTTNWGCKNIHSETITVNPNITPIFNPVTPICSGTSLNPLPTTSNNGIYGTWSPILNNTATT
ncbi:PKD domain-containing protein, partial [Flavobacterium sp.]|uniref:PKD domain-containing protein n=1 Tax=Flavobacterium sp. TaxID=239 RepID=UPI0037C1882A